MRDAASCISGGATVEAALSNRLKRTIRTSDQASTQTLPKIHTSISPVVPYVMSREVVSGEPASAEFAAGRTAARLASNARADDVSRPVNASAGTAPSSGTGTTGNVTIGGVTSLSSTRSQSTCATNGCLPVR